MSAASTGSMTFTIECLNKTNAWKQRNGIFEMPFINNQLQLSYFIVMYYNSPTHYIVRGSSSGIVDKVLDYYPYGREFSTCTNIGRDSLFQIRQSNIP